MTDASQKWKILAVAPMMAWTNTHCRYLHRLFSAQALLFTEMANAEAIVHGPQAKLLRFHPAEKPLACQLGGSNPDLLARAAEAVAEAGFDEINFNVGCPSPRVRRGRFGAALMARPEAAARCVKAMGAATGLPVTVKCRLGIDDLDTDRHLNAFVAAIAAAGCRRLYVHARKAFLNGLSAAQNRNIPPLQPERVYGLKARFPELTIILNGGITTLATAQAHLLRTDGIMVGRGAWHEPRFLGTLDSMMFGTPPTSELRVADAYLAYMREQLANGAPLADLTKPMLGLFKGWPGARRFRQQLSCPQPQRRGSLDSTLAPVVDAIAAVAPPTAAAA